MWRAFTFLGILGAASASALAAAPTVSDPENQRAQVQIEQQLRIEALAMRGRQDFYQQLLKAGQTKAPLPESAGHRAGLSTGHSRAMSREVAINLAALGFSAADVTAYRKRNIDLFDLSRKLFSASAAHAEQMLLADTVVVATAGKVLDGRPRLDGFLSATPLAVVKSLKGSRTLGDTIYLARKSGKTPDGLLLQVSSEPDLIPDRNYLFVMSRNLYEQWAAEKGKRPDVGYNALPYLIYEVSADGVLLPGPKPSRSCGDPKDIKAVESQLKKFAI